MSDANDDLTFSAEDFCGRARLFPLPNLVLFPHVIQPLHIFEPRYVELLHDAIEADRLITMAILRPGWQNNYEGRPPVANFACLGRILTWHALPNRRYNLLLLGVRRVRIAHELPASRAFREADVELIEDHYCGSGSKCRRALQRELISVFRKAMPDLCDAEELLSHLSVDTVSLGTLTDVIAYALDLDLCAKYELLAEPDVDKRAKWLLGHLKSTMTERCQVSVAAGFPPSFSSN
jgi:Lon protease-like protein